MTLTLTPGQRWLLAALIETGGAATPDELIAAYPHRFPGADNPDGREIRSARFSLHRTGSHLVDMGLAKRGKRMVRGRSGQVQGGATLYRVSPLGRRVSA